MARIVYSGLVTSIRGSVGGTTFQKNGFGYTVKNKPKMVLPLSQDQALSKLILRTITGYWRQLSSSNRNDWNTYASTYPQYSAHNPAVQISGYTLFCMWGFQYLLGTFVENTPVLSPSLFLPATPVVGFTLTKPTSSELTLGSTFTPSSSDWNCNVYLSQAVPPTINFVGSRPRFIALIDSSITSMDITGEYASKFGKLPEIGDRIALRYVLYALFGGRVVASTHSIVTVT